MRDAMRDAKCKIWQEMHEPGLNLENPSVPLERWDEIAWKRYKERRNQSYGLEMANDSNMTPVYDLQQVAN